MTSPGLQLAGFVMGLFAGTNFFFEIFEGNTMVCQIFYQNFYKPDALIDQISGLLVRTRGHKFRMYLELAKI